MDFLFPLVLLLFTPSWSLEIVESTAIDDDDDVDDLTSFMAWIMSLDIALELLFCRSDEDIDDDVDDIDDDDVDSDLSIMINPRIWMVLPTPMSSARMRLEHASNE